MTAADDERVILVDVHDARIGTEEKLRAHELGLLHRAFSVFVVRTDGSVLLQRRALGKYHSAGLWSNTACGHPRPSEGVGDAAHRRLYEEMGISCPLREVASFTYRRSVTGRLVEHEFDHVFLGLHDRDPVPDPAEVMEWRWLSPPDLEHELTTSPHSFSCWLPLAWQALHMGDDVSRGR